MRDQAPCFVRAVRPHRSMSVSPRSGGGYGQASMFHAFGGDQAISEVPNGLGRTAHNQNFHARMVIEMHVQCGDDQIAVVVLDVSQQALDVALVVVIDQRHRPGDLLVPHLAEMFDQVGTDHICNSLRAVGIPLGLHHVI